MAATDQEAEEQREACQGRSRDKGNDPRGRVALPKVGEQVESGDDAEQNDRPEVDGRVAADEQESQVFAGVVGAAPLILPTSMSCEIRSSGTGKTTTVFRSTPISVRVCK